MSDEETFGDASYRRMRDELRGRVGKRRFEHSKGVAKTARKLARVYGLDEGKARMAGILHDWDKGFSPEEETARAYAFGLDAQLPRAVIDDMPWLLHGPVAAAELARTHPEFGAEVFQAIARHTSGAADMAPLDIVVYVADVIEPNRAYDDMAGLGALRNAVGTATLDELYFQTFRYTFLYLVQRGKQMHPDTLAIWNALVARRDAAVG